MRISAWLVLVAVLFAGIIVAGNTITGLRGVYGPYKCVGSCALAWPTPDRGTFAFIQTMDAAFVNQSGHHHFFQKKGDAIIVCNDTVCVKYTRVGADRWEGDEPYPAPKNNSSGAGGVGGGSGSQGGYGGWFIGGSGCIYGCGSGKVTVGPVDNVKQQ